MTSSRGANIPSESTRSFSKHMHVVDALTSAPSPPTRALLPTFYTPAGSLSSLCARTHAPLVCFLLARCARLSGSRARIAAAESSWDAALPFPPPAEPLVVNEWQQDSTGRTLFHHNVWTLGLSRATWILDTQTGSVSVAGWAWVFERRCVCQWRRDEWLFATRAISLLRGRVEGSLPYSTLCRSSVVQVTLPRRVKLGQLDWFCWFYANFPSFGINRGCLTICVLRIQICDRCRKIFKTTKKRYNYLLNKRIRAKCAVRCAETWIRF